MRSERFRLLSKSNLRNKLPGKGRGHRLGKVWTKKWMAIGFSTLVTLVQDLVIWDTVRLLWFHPAHGLGGNAYAMANC